MDDVPDRSNPLRGAGLHAAGAADRLPSSTIRGWFAEHELGRCPRCHTDSVVTVESGVSYCLECGHLPDGSENGGAPLRPSA
jgi:hypothetical protein